MIPGFQYPDDVVRGCTKYLLGISELTILLGQYDNGTPFLFEQDILQNMEKVSVKWPGNAVTALVVKSGGSWASPQPQSTERFPKIDIEVWADPPRNREGMITKPFEARVAGEWVATVLDQYMNFTSSEVVMFGSRPIFRSYRLGEFTWLPVINSDNGVMVGTVSYGLQTAAFFS